MKFYDGLTSSYGVHTIRIHLQSEEFKGYFDCEIDGNTKGVDLLSFDFSDWENEDFNELIKENSMHGLKISGVMDSVVMGNYGYDEYIYKITIFNEENPEESIYGDYTSAEANSLIVGIEIIDFKEEKE